MGNRKVFNNNKFSDFIELGFKGRKFFSVR